MDVGVEVSEGVAEVILDAPPLNLITTRTYDALADVLGGLRARDDLHALILTGAGPRAFSAGADLREVRAAQASSPAERWGRADDTLGMVRDFPVPTIAAINGHALGAGLVLAAMCTMRIASAKASLGLPEVRHGLSGGVSALLGAGVHAAWTDWMVVSGTRVDAPTAMAMGLVQVVVDGDARDRARQLAADLCGVPRDALVANTALVNELRESRGRDARARERRVFQ